MEQSITNEETEESFFTSNLISESIDCPKAFIFGQHFKTRVFSFVALVSLVSGFGYLSQQGYYIVGDSFVAPAILSPDSDVVIDQKLKLSELLLEKGRAEQALAEADGDLEAGEKAVVKLNDLKNVASKSLTWTRATTGQQVSMGTSDIQTLNQQNLKLQDMLGRQAVLTSEAMNNLEAGAITKPEYLQQVQALDQVQIALFENERTKMQSDLLLNQATMGQRALNSPNGSMPMPEQVISMNQLITVELQLLQTEADIRAKTAEKEKDQNELGKINQLEIELKSRPIFQAIEKQQDVAFAPYQSLRGIVPGARLMDCTWGTFNCREVGKVVSIIPGETILPDIFGSGQVRGQFLALDLNKNDHDESMHSKVLRVRK